MPLPTPASRSTRTVWPRDVRLRTPAGVIPTRYSRVLISFGTPMITRVSLGEKDSPDRRIADGTELERPAGPSAAEPRAAEPSRAGAIGAVRAGVRQGVDATST